MNASQEPIVDSSNDKTPTALDASKALNKIPDQIKSSILDYLGSHPNTTFETNELSIRSEKNGTIDVRSIHGFQNADDIPPLVWIELLHEIAVIRAEEIAED